MAQDMQRASAFSVTGDWTVTHYRVAVSSLTTTTVLLSLWSGELEDGPTTLIEGGVPIPISAGDTAVYSGPSLLNPSIVSGQYYYVALRAANPSVDYIIWQWNWAQDPQYSRWIRSGEGSWGLNWSIYSNVFEVQGVQASVPEPASWLTILSGLSLFAVRRWRSRFHLRIPG
jgi:hypothetical protein